MAKTIQTLFGTYDETQLKAIRSAIDEINVSMTKMDFEKQLIKEIIDVAYDNFKIPKKILKKMATVKYKQTFTDEVAENKEFEALFDGITEVR